MFKGEVDGVQTAEQRGGYVLHHAVITKKGNPCCRDPLSQGNRHTPATCNTYTPSLLTEDYVVRVVRY